MSEINYDELAEAPVTVSDDEVQSIAQLAERQMVLEDWIEGQEERLKEAKKNLTKLTGELLPEAMRQAGVKEFTLDNGCKIEVDQDIKASITRANLEDALNWLRENEWADTIRHEFKISYGKGEDEMSDNLLSFLAETGQDFNEKTFVHPQTLKALVKRELEANDHGEDWEKMFGVYRFKYTKIVRPKA
jgi:hypothetical protein